MPAQYAPEIKQCPPPEARNPERHVRGRTWEEQPKRNRWQIDDEKQQINRALQVSRTRNRDRNKQDLADEIDDGREQCDTEKLVHVQYAASDFPIRKQHTLLGVAFGVALVRHPQIGPTHAIPARDEAAERLGVPALAANRDPPN